MANGPGLTVTEAPNLRPVTKIEGGLRALIAHLRDDLEEGDDPRAKARFESDAETLGGLLEAFEDYERAAGPHGKGRRTAGRT